MRGDHNKRTRRQESIDTRNSSNTRVEDNTNVDAGTSKSRWGFRRWRRSKGTRKRTEASRNGHTSSTIEVQTEKEKPPRKMPVWFVHLFRSSIELDRFYLSKVIFFDEAHKLYVVSSHYFFTFFCLLLMILVLLLFNPLRR